MSVVAWDGKMLAADKQATCAGARFKTTKIKRIASGEVLAWTGDEAAGLVMTGWYEDGADPAKYPAFQADKEKWCRLIVADARGAKFFEQYPAPIRVEEAFAAWGAGRDFAMAAMHCGKTACEAVEVTNVFSVDCGCGVDAIELA